MHGWSIPNDLKLLLFSKCFVTIHFLRLVFHSTDQRSFEVGLRVLNKITPGVGNLHRRRRSEADMATSGFSSCHFFKQTHPRRPLVGHLSKQTHLSRCCFGIYRSRSIEPDNKPRYYYLADSIQGQNRI